MLKGLGDCEHCKSYIFTSKTEKERHLKVFHRHKQLSKKHISRVISATALRYSSQFHKQANKHTAQDMTTLNLKQPRKSKNSKPKKKKRINQVYNSLCGCNCYKSL